MIRHHPDDALLMALASGSLARGPAAVAEAHVEHCPLCRGRIDEFAAVGGALLEGIDPVVLAPEALARTLARIDALAPAREPAGAAANASADTSPRADASATASGHARLRASLPDGVFWPKSLRGAAATPWRWLGPGMRWSRVTLADDRAANVFLLRIAAGKCLPVHSHRGVELTQVLYGAFHDGRERFAAGDFDEADDRVHHQPIVEADGECICLASVEGRVAFDGTIARVFGALVGM